MKPILSVAVAGGIAITIATQELVHHGLPPHITNDIEILDPPNGRLALTAETSGEAIQGNGVFHIIKRDG